MKALITGGGGFLGSHITEQLLGRGDQVRVFCRNRHAELDHLNIEWFPGDIRDGEAVAAACRGMDVVFHVAGVPGVWGPWVRFHGINTRGTENVIAGCLKHEVGKLVYTSSPSVVFDGTCQCRGDESLPYPDRYLCYYPRSKALAEQAVLAANDRDGLSTVSLRPHLMWGPRDRHLVPRVIAAARSGRLRRVGSGENLISVAYVENAAAAHLAAADALQRGAPVAGQTYFINEPEPVKLWAWVDQLLERAGLPPVRRSISAASARRLGAVMEMLYWTLRLPGEPPMTRFAASQLSCSHYYDVSKARRDFGYAPQISMDEGLRRIEPELKRWARG